MARAKTREGQEFTLYFAPAGALARIDYMGPSPTGPTAQTEIFSDWRPAAVSRMPGSTQSLDDLGAIQYPRTRHVRLVGEPFLEAHVTSLMINPALADSLFAPPGH